MVTKREADPQFPRYFEHYLQCDPRCDRCRRNPHRYRPLEPPPGFFFAHFCDDIRVAVCHRRREFDKQLAGPGITSFNSPAVTANSRGSDIDITRAGTDHCGRTCVSRWIPGGETQFLTAEFASQLSDSRYLG